MIPFAFFGFWGTTLAVAAAAASIPVIIHLLNRRRFQVVTWAAMRFLLNAQKKNTRKMRLEQLILLLLRVALVLLLVLAMASIMPWAEDLWAGLGLEGSGLIQKRAGRIHKIIVLDGSMSMAARQGGNDTAFDAARQRALEILEQSQAGDAFSVLLMKDHPEWVVPGVSFNRAAVKDALEKTKQAHGNADVPTTLKQISEKLAESPRRFRTRQVYFLTDLQKSTWLPGRGDDKQGQGVHVLLQAQVQQIQKRAQTIFVDVHKKNANNLAITNLSLSRPLITTGMEVSIDARIKHFGLVMHQNLRVELRIGRGRGDPKDTSFKMTTARVQSLSIKPGENKPINIRHKFSKPGVYAVQVRLAGDDLEPDNSRTIIVTVRDNVPVLLVNGQPAADPFDTATEYLKFALQPFPPGVPIPKFVPFRPTVINTAQFTNASEINLANYDCIFLCNVDQVTSGQLRRLETHLRRGGGVVVSMGDAAANNLKMYNDFLYKDGKGLLPAKLIGTEQAPPKHYFTPHIESGGWKHSALRAFGDAKDQIALTRARLQSYVRAEPAHARDAQVILKLVSKRLPTAQPIPGQILPSGDPLLLAWNPPLPRDKNAKPAARKPGQPRRAHRYRGKVALMTSTWNMDWASWAGSPSSVALVNELTRYAISGRLREHATLVSEPLEEYLLAGGTRFTVRLKLPDGTTRSLRTTGQGDVTLFHWPQTDRGGVYEMTVGQDTRDYLFAVNVPIANPFAGGSESELRTANKAEMKKAYPRWEFEIVQRLADVVHRMPTESGEDQWVQAKLGPEIARMVLYVVVVVLWLEVILACVFGRFTTVPGATVRQGVQSAIWPVSLAIAAGAAFMLVGAVLFHAAATGDFLGFLPNSTRGWIESWSGIPAPPSGEGRKWEPEFSSYFIDRATDPWLAGGMLLAYAVALFFIYRKEGHNIAPQYKVMLGGLRWFLMFLAVGIWLPQLQVNIKRESWPDVIVLLDDSLSMGELDQFQDEKVRKSVKEMGEKIRGRLQKQLPGQIKKLQETVNEKHRELAGTKNDDVQRELDALEKKLGRMEKQLAILGSDSWRPTRLQLAQMLVHNEKQDWLQQLLGIRQMKVHVYHLNALGKALKLANDKGKPITLADIHKTDELDNAHQAVAQLEPYATESQLGTSVRQVLDHFGGSSVAAVIVLTDGITTSSEGQSGYERNMAKVAEYAALKGVPLFLVGIGDDHELRDLRLHDLQVEDTVYVKERINFEARLTGKGFKNTTVPVVLKIREPNGTETEVDRQIVKIDPTGKPVDIHLKDKADEPGKRVYIVEVIPPTKTKQDRAEYSNLRLQRDVFIQEARPVKVLLVEGSARFEFRFLKSLLEREKLDNKGNRRIEVKVLLVDAEAGWAKTDNVAIAKFPFNKAKLNEYDAVILGDVDPYAPQLGDNNLRMLADFVREDGRGLLMVSGPLFSPHAYRKTPLADVLPIEPDRVPPPEDEILTEGYRPALTLAGQLHRIFRLTPNQARNADIWANVEPMFWWCKRFKVKPAAQVLAVHPTALGAEKIGPNKELRQPLVVLHFAGAGRCMFFGFEETWLWRHRDDEKHYNDFWLATVDFLTRRRPSHTRLFLDRQTPYRQGEEMKITVRFPDDTSPKEIQQARVGPGTEVKVMVKYRPDSKNKKRADVETDSMQLAKVEGSWNVYQGTYPATRKGKYEFWLSTPDVSAQQPNGKAPSAEADVELPPGEMDRLRMNREELEKAASVSDGRFYTVATAGQLIEELPSGYRVLLNSEAKPWVVWNHTLMFLLAIGIMTAEWLLRKRKHLL